MREVEGVNETKRNKWRLGDWAPFANMNEAKGQQFNQSKTMRPIYEIAREIKKDWGAKVNFAAKPYLDAMMSLDSIDDNYFFDSAKSVVLYFLSNASTWRGETAKRIKAELKAMCK